MTRPRWRHPDRGETQPRREASGPVSGPDHTEPITQERPALTPSELRPETWTRLMVAVMRLPVGSDPGILPGSGP